MKRRLWVTVAAAGICAALFTCATGFGQENGGFVGSDGCGMCHQDKQETWSGHGHSKILRKVVDGRIPEGASATLPESVGWQDVSYLVGGANVYARFLDTKGFVMTGQGKQWSIDGGVHTAFKPDVPNGSLAYDCIKCHSVGWRDGAPYEKGVADDLEGIPGARFQNGVGCEACHGPGHEHVMLKDKRDLKEQKGDLKITKSKSADLCGGCHKRTDDGSVLVVAPTLMQSRQQFSEWSHSKKGQLSYPKCADCHNSHVSSGMGDGFVRACEDCHKGSQAKPVKIAAMRGLSCRDCHMPPADRGAWDATVKEYRHGDTHSHVFGITLDSKYTLDDGSGKATVTGDGLVRLTVDMTCARCHKSGEAHNMVTREMLAVGKKVH